MFAKLLKYDLTHYIKLWLVGAVSVVVFGAVGGWCHRLQPHVPEFAGDDFLRMMLGSMSVISIISIVAFMILGVVLVLMRYAKNCFSDEAYLTFTLPVKRGYYTLISVSLPPWRGGTAKHETPCPLCGYGIITIS